MPDLSPCAGCRRLVSLGPPRRSCWSERASRKQRVGIRAFAFLDPEGYQIEVQTAGPGR